MKGRYEISRCLNCWFVEVGLFIRLSSDFAIDTNVINTTVYPSFLWLRYWYQRYQYDCLSVFPLTSLLISALSIRLFIVLSPDFTIDTSVINKTVYPSFLWLRYWYQRYQYDCLSVFPLTSLLIPALSIRLFIRLSSDFTIDTSVINTTVYPSFPDFIVHTWVNNNVLFLKLDTNRILSMLLRVAKFIVSNPNYNYCMYFYFTLI